MTTVYLGGDAIQLSGGSVTEIDRTYDFPDGPSAVRVATTSGSSLHWQAADPHGTGTVDITADDLTVTRRLYTPFGQDRTPTTNQGWAGDKGFVGGTRDDTNHLTNLGARQYSPTLGRFLSPDPDLDHTDPQALNNYAYSDNVPTNKSDPDGQRLACTAAIPCGPIDSHHPYGRYSGDSRYTGPHPTLGYSHGRTEHYSYVCHGWSDGGSCYEKLIDLGSCIYILCTPHEEDISQVDWADVLLAYLGGAGGTYSFQDGDYFAEQIKKDPYLRNVIMSSIAAKIAAGKSNGQDGKSYYDGIGGYIQGVKDANPKNMEVFELGSYHVNWHRSGKTSSGQTKVTLEITNQLSNESIAHYKKAIPNVYPYKTLRDNGEAMLGVVNNVPNVTTDITITMTIP